MTPSMRVTAELYEVAGAASLSRLCVDHEEFQAFSLGLTALISQLGDDAADPYWEPVVRRLRRIRWELAVTPLPFDNSAFGLAESAEFVARSVGECERIYPAYAGAAETISRRLAALATTPDDPLGAAVLELLSAPLPPPEDESGDEPDSPDSLAGGSSFSSGASERPDTALVLRQARQSGAVEEHFALAGYELDVVVPAQLAQPRVYDQAVVIGPSVWFPSHVFNSPRARRVDIVHYAWLRDRLPHSAIFSASEEDPSSRSPIALSPHAIQSHDGAGADPLDFLPHTDWAAITAATAPAEGAGAARADTVEAYLLLLASDQAVYLESEEGSRAYVVVLGAENELRQAPTASIEPGTYLVTRVGGEGDYIPAIADGLLGSTRESLRAAQRRWKAMLNELIETSGVPEVIRHLEGAGSSRASEANVRRWASDTSIRTQDYADFLAIMKIVGLEEEAEMVWRQMAAIDQAHLKAGQRVRALLDREILKADTRELERRGWMDYDVADIEGEGALRVARVEARAPETVCVSRRQTRQPFAVERDLWPG